VSEEATKPKVKQSTMIYQANALVSSIYRLSMPGKRVLAMAFGVVGNQDVKSNGDPARDVFPFIASLTVADYAAIFGVPLRTASVDVYAGVMELTTAAFTFHSTDAKGKPVRDVYPWLHHTNIVEAKTERGVYTLNINPDVLDYIGLLGGRYTEYDLLNVGQLSAFNQWRLYEKLAENKNPRPEAKKAGKNYGTWITNFEFFAGDYFDLGASIKVKPSEMKRRFLDAALDAVNEKTDLFVEESTPSGKQWVFKIFTGDIANKKREKYRQAKAEAEAEKKKAARLKRLAKQIEAHKSAEE